MGLILSHGCWEGPYTTFHRFRAWVARQAGIDLDAMQGFEPPGATAPGISWATLPADPLHTLLDHPDDQGYLPVAVLLPLATRLQEILDRVALQPSPEDAGWLQRLRRMIAGLRLAARRGDPVRFG